MPAQGKEPYLTLEQAQVEKATNGYVPQQLAYVNIPQAEHDTTLFPFMYGHDKWPHKVEKAFTTALRLIMKSGTSKIKVRNKNYGRNELISLYIRYETGEVRTKKQISSHIQVWKKSILNKSSSNMRLTTLDTEILNLIERGAEQTEESLKRFYGTFETIIDSLSKEAVINPYQTAPTFIDPNRNVTNIYPQQYSREIAYGNFKSIVPTNNEMIANGQIRYAYPVNAQSYIPQQPNSVPMQYYPGYVPVENYPVQQYDMAYAVNNKPPFVNYQRPLPEYYKPAGEVVDPHYMPQAPEGWQGAPGIPYQGWASPAQSVQIPHPHPRTRDVHTEQAHIQSSSQYSAGPPPSIGLTGGVVPVMAETDKIPQPSNVFNPVLQQHHEMERVKLPPLPQPGFPAAGSSQINAIPQPDVGKQNSLNNRMGTPAGIVTQHTTVSPTPVMTTPLDGSQFGRGEPMKHPVPVPNEAAAHSETPTVTGGPPGHIVPGVYRSPPTQPAIPNQQAGKQPVVILPAYPYYQQPPGHVPVTNHTSSNESTSESLPSMRPQ